MNPVDLTLKNTWLGMPAREWSSAYSDSKDEKILAAIYEASLTRVPHAFNYFNLPVLDHFSTVLDKATDTLIPVPDKTPTQQDLASGLATISSLINRFHRHGGLAYNHAYLKSQPAATRVFEQFRTVETYYRLKNLLTRAELSEDEARPVLSKMVEKGIIRRSEFWVPGLIRYPTLHLGYEGIKLFTHYQDNGKEGLEELVKFSD